MNYIQPFLMLSSILFCLGLYAVITRKNAVAILMGIELILNSANINFITFNRFGSYETLDGHVFTIFVIVLVAAEAAVALAIIINLFKNIGTVDVDHKGNERLMLETIQILSFLFFTSFIIYNFNIFRKQVKKPFFKSRYVSNWLDAYKFNIFNSKSRTI